MAKNKMGEIYNDMLETKPPSIKEIPKKEPLKGSDSFIRVNFFISKNQKDKLREYTRKISPGEHIKISQSELIRFLIESLDSINIENTRREFFKLK